MSRNACAVLLLAMTLLVAGCFDTGEELSSEEQVEAAVARFPMDLQDGGAIQKLGGEASIEGTSATFEIEFGANDALRLTIDGVGFRVEMTCVGDRVFFSLGGVTYEGRADDMCDLELDQAPDVSFMDEADWDVIGFTEGSDGTLEATVRTMEDGEEEIMKIVVEDARIIRFVIEEDGEEMTFEVTYGKRSKIDAPTADDRMPASVEWDNDFEASTYTGHSFEVDAAVPLDELRLLVVEFGEEEERASFVLTESGTQTQAGFSFQFVDDGDGLLSEGDSFTLHHDDWMYEWDHDVAFFDEWAGMRTDESPMPAPGLAWLAVALLGFVPLIRRRG